MLNGHAKEDEGHFSYPAGRYKVFRLLPADPYSRELLPKVYARALTFIEKYHVEADKVWLGNMLFSNFHAQSNLVHILVATDEHDMIVAHAISYVDRHEAFGNYCLIYQIEKDCPETGIVEVGHPLIDEWTRSLGLKTQINMTTDEAHERLYKRFGFSRWKIMMRRNLDEVTP